MSQYAIVEYDSVLDLQDTLRKCWGQAYVEWDYVPEMSSLKNTIYGAAIDLENNNQVAAFVAHDDGKVMIIKYLSVLPDYRNLGLGGFCLNYLIALARNADKCISLRVRVSNLYAIHLYEKAGFHISEYSETLFEEDKENDEDGNGAGYVMIWTPNLS
jgi:ribosomal protein S18 acetylase RimI-like enzyme